MHAWLYIEKEHCSSRSISSSKEMHLVAQRRDLSPQRIMHCEALSPLVKQRKLHVMVFTMHPATQSPMSLSACEDTVSPINRRRAINTTVFIGGAIGTYVRS